MKIQSFVSLLTAGVLLAILFTQGLRPSPTVSHAITLHEEKVQKLQAELDQAKKVPLNIGLIAAMTNARFEPTTTAGQVRLVIGLDATAVFDEKVRVHFREYLPPSQKNRPPVDQQLPIQTSRGQKFLEFKPNWSVDRGLITVSRTDYRGELGFIVAYDPQRRANSLEDLRVWYGQPTTAEKVSF